MEILVCALLILYLGIANSQSIETGDEYIGADTGIGQEDQDSREHVGQEDNIALVQKVRGPHSLEALSDELREQLGQAADAVDAIPGEPEQDYPVFDVIPRTSFTCADKNFPGYFADIEARCQVFHICEAGGAKHSFLCPSGSVFNQKYLVCAWWYDFVCEEALHLFADQWDLGKLYPESSSIGPEAMVNNNFERHEHFQSKLSLAGSGPNNGDGVYSVTLPPESEHNHVFISESDIFHSAETGVPNRDIFNDARDSNDYKNSSQLKFNTWEDNSQHANKNKQDGNISHKNTKQMEAKKSGTNLQENTGTKGNYYQQNKKFKVGNRRNNTFQTSQEWRSNLETLNTNLSTTSDRSVDLINKSTSTDVTITDSNDLPKDKDVVKGQN